MTMAATATFLSPTVVQLDLYRGSLKLSSATGFFLRLSDRWHVVSNWHVFSGRNPSTGLAMHAHGAVPDNCQFGTFDFQDGPKWHTYSLGELSTGTSTWFEHPHFGQDVDVGTLPTDLQKPGLAKDLLDPTGHDKNMWVDLGGELFLPGFPLGLSAPARMPIWKRASLATSTEFGEGIDKFVLVDTASCEGMSGSPCLAISNWKHYALDRETGKMTIVERPLSVRLIGVYSGRRIINGELGAQLGIVWRENLIFDTIKFERIASLRLL